MVFYFKMKGVVMNSVMEGGRNHKPLLVQRPVLNFGVPVFLSTAWQRTLQPSTTYSGSKGYTSTLTTVRYKCNY